MSTFWTDTELNLYINEALRIWNVLTAYNQATTGNITLTGASNGLSTTSNIAADCLAPLRIVDQTTKKTWVQLSLLDTYMTPLWLSVITGTPGAWIPMGLTRFFIYPMAVSNNVKVDYIRTAPTPSIDGDYIQVGEDDLPAIIDYVVFIAHLKEGGAELQAAIPLLQNFLKQAAKYNAKVADSLLFRHILGLPGQEDTRKTSKEGLNPRG